MKLEVTHDQSASRMCGRNTRYVGCQVVFGDRGRKWNQRAAEEVEGGETYLAASSRDCAAATGFAFSLAAGTLGRALTVGAHAGPLLLKPQR
jgi:hypothetical protein